ncbi:hypothetical protein AYR72_gp025 [Cnaphalocrocis medinalis granulovirus]|uniref:ORF28 n=1 Tax=Cnaphalocrocis medinalis granulovirus TaxID=1750712 RepID=A0A0X9DW45_9BBAC|nr:hypothetical protein AYR72_gp025 [Cnaphalocrocis medinalis granulovirus]ALN41961.1 ORF28 [Cnaphalocrocis medinalis granulovirus]AMF83776.1 hypothetical protein [Cnaphalocrocis medinalis granulovirus]
MINCSNCNSPQFKFINSDLIECVICKTVLFKCIRCHHILHDSFKYCVNCGLYLLESKQRVLKLKRLQKAKEQKAKLLKTLKQFNKPSTSTSENVFNKPSTSTTNKNVFNIYINDDDDDDDIDIIESEDENFIEAVDKFLK